MEESKPFFVKLKKRGLICLSGKERYDFLQKLVSNDIKALKNAPMLYSFLLTPQGKFLFDFFVVDKEDTLILDCEGDDRAKALYDELSKYKLRSQVNLEYNQVNHVYTIHNSKNNLNAYADPRHNKLGLRTFEKPDIEEEKDFDTWDRLRIQLTIPDGSRDMVAGQSTLLEFRVDEMNGVSFDKGCYIGQEVTARMKHRGLVKKHIYTISFSEKPLINGAPITYNDKNIGTMCSHCNDIGLAVLKDEHVNAFWPNKAIVI
jgi:folate-binding protein YgfZ